MSLMDYLASMLKAVAQRKLMKPRQTGSGEYKTPGPTKGKYTGEKLREVRATHGVGRPIPVKAIVGDDNHAVVVPAGAIVLGTVPTGTLGRDIYEKLVPAERTIAEIAAWTPGAENAVGTVANVYAAAVALHGSQRKAAAALGMNLSTFQRALKKSQS